MGQTSDEIDFVLVFFVLSRVQTEIGEVLGGFVQARGTERRGIEDRAVESGNHHAKRDAGAATTVTEFGLHRPILLGQHHRETRTPVTVGLPIEGEEQQRAAFVLTHIRADSGGGSVGAQTTCAQR